MLEINGERELITDNDANSCSRDIPSWVEFRAELACCVGILYLGQTPIA